MLFRKKIEPRCSYCLYCAKLGDEQVLCSRHGVMPMEGKCFRFSYDPCKRVPGKPKALDLSKYEHEDYSL